MKHNHVEMAELERTCFSRILASAARGSAGDPRDLHILHNSPTEEVRDLATRLGGFLSDYLPPAQPKKRRGATAPAVVAEAAE